METMAPVDFVRVLVVVGLGLGLITYFVAWALKGAGHFSKLFQ